MEINDDKLRQIVRETLRELGPHADPARCRKWCASLRQLQKRDRHTPSGGGAIKPSLPICHCAIPRQRIIEYAFQDRPAQMDCRLADLGRT
jgi:hypothetical protein